MAIKEGANIEMEQAKIEKYLISLKGSKSSQPFGPDALVFKVMDKMFALVSQQSETPKVTLKCNPVDAVVLVSQFAAVVPGYHMNKKHWITVSLSDDLPDDMMVDLVNQSYELVVSQLTKAKKSELGLNK